MINAGIPTVFVNAEEIGYRGTELREEINGDPQQLARFERIRVAGALRMGLIKTPEEAATRQHTPKIAFVAPPRDYRTASGKLVAAGDIDLLVRALSMGKLHHAMMGTAAVAIGTAAAIPGTPGTCRRRRRTQRGTLRPSLRHPASGRRGQPGERRMDGDQGDHEPQRANPHGRLGARTRRRLLNRPILAPAFRHRERPGRLAATTRKPSPNQPDPRGNPPLTNHWSTR